MMKLEYLHFAITHDDTVTHASFRHKEFTSSPLRLRDQQGLRIKDPYAIAFRLYYESSGAIGAQFQNWEIAEAELVDHELYIPNQDITVRFLQQVFTFAPLILVNPQTVKIATHDAYGTGSRSRGSAILDREIERLIERLKEVAVSPSGESSCPRGAGRSEGRCSPPRPSAP